MAQNLKATCIICGYLQSQHALDTLRCPPPNINGTRWTEPHWAEIALVEKNLDQEFITCPICYALVRTENSAKHAAFHEGAKAWFEHLLKEKSNG